MYQEIPSYDLIFIGAGPATIFSLLKLTEEGYEGKILVIDKGKDSYNRTSKEILNGMGGAGTYSDFKMVFPYYECELDKYVQYKQPYFDFIKQQINNFYLRGKINKTLPVKYNNLPKDIYSKDSEIWHIGSKKAPILISFIYDYLCTFKNINFMFNIEVNDIDFKQKYLKISGYPISYDKLIIAPGRAGSKWLNQILKENKIQTKSGEMNLGIRFECKLTKKIQETIKQNYDFKFAYKYRNMEFRTFCCNENGYVVLEKNVYGNINSFNGHSYNSKEKNNGLENFAILGCWQTKDLKKEYTKLEKKLDKVFKLRLKDIGLRKSEILTKNSFVYYSHLISDRDHLTKSFYDDHIFAIKKDHLIKIFGKKYIEGLFIFVDKLVKYFKIKAYNMYIPEIKLNSGNLPINEDMQLKKYNDVYIIGDVANLRGIVQSACSGIMVAKDIAK